MCVEIYISTCTLHQTIIFKTKIKVLGSLQVQVYLYESIKLLLDKNKFLKFKMK